MIRELHAWNYSHTQEVFRRMDREDLVAYNATMTIAEVLTEYIATTGLTQDDVAVRLGTNQSKVNRWANGVNVPKDDQVPALAALTGLSERRIIEAIHRSRTMKIRLEDRVSALEEQVARLIAIVEAEL